MTKVQRMILELMNDCGGSFDTFQKSIYGIKEPSLSRLEQGGMIQVVNGRKGLRWELTTAGKREARRSQT